MWGVPPGSESRDIIGSASCPLCVEMFLTGVLWKIQWGFAFSISAALGNQLTGLPVFTVNYGMQVMTLLWLACKMAWKWFSLRQHSCILHSIQMNGEDAYSFDCTLCPFPRLMAPRLQGHRQVIWAPWKDVTLGPRHHGPCQAIKYATEQICMPIWCKTDTLSEKKCAKGHLLHYKSFIFFYFIHFIIHRLWDVC